MAHIATYLYDFSTLFGVVSMLRLRALLSALSFGAMALMFSACGPTYPKCENDEHCAEKGEYCLNNRCEQCADNSHCPTAGMECQAGKCGYQLGYCDPARACPGNQKCRDNQCGAECLDNSECGAGQFCDGGNCTSKPECGPNADTAACPAGSNCEGGRCVVSLAQCSTEPVYFDFNQASVKRNQRSKLDSIAQCLKGDNVAPITIQGHCDERGTEEYNLALGERRAEAARRYLESAGVSSSKLSTVSYGESRPAENGSNSSAWRKNRRAEFVAQ